MFVGGMFPVSPQVLLYWQQAYRLTPGIPIYLSVELKLDDQLQPTLLRTALSEIVLKLDRARIVARRSLWQSKEGHLGAR